jgi:hypothetical protein
MTMIDRKVSRLERAEQKRRAKAARRLEKSQRAHERRIRAEAVAKPAAPSPEAQVAQP